MATEIMEIAGLAYRISKETKTDVMIYYHGHVDKVDIGIYIDGYSEEKIPANHIVPLGREPYCDEITPSCAIKLLKELLKRG